jgi:hypothetical protein
MTNQAQLGHLKQHWVSEAVEGFDTLAELARICVGGGIMLPLSFEGSSEAPVDHSKPYRVPERSSPIFLVRKPESVSGESSE